MNPKDYLKSIMEFFLICVASKDFILLASHQSSNEFCEKVILSVTETGET